MLVYYFRIGCIIVTHVYIQFVSAGHHILFFLADLQACVRENLNQQKSNMKKKTHSESHHLEKTIDSILVYLYSCFS